MAKHHLAVEGGPRHALSGAPARMLRDQGHIDALEVLHQCFVYVMACPQASRRLLVLRDSETPWATCLQVLQREFPAAPKVAVVPPTV